MNWVNTLTSELQFISFNVANEEYGLNVLDIEEIIRLPQITKLPKTPDFIKGVINLRGNVIPVLDMRERLSIERIDYNFFTRAIIVKVNEKKLGLIVDRVNKVYRISKEKIDMSENLSNQISSDYIKGIGKMDDRIVIFINIDELFSDNEIDHLSNLKTRAELIEKENAIA